MGLESAAVPSASPRVALSGEDAIGSEGMPAWVSKRGKATRAGLGQHEVLPFSVVVGEAKTMEHRGGVEDTLTHLRMDHRPRAVHTGNIPYRGSGAVYRARTALAGRGPHQRLLHMVHGLKYLQSLLNMSSVFDQAALVLAGGQRIVRERSRPWQGDGFMWIFPLP